MMIGWVDSMTDNTGLIMEGEYAIMDEDMRMVMIAFVGWHRF